MAVTNFVISLFSWRCCPDDKLEFLAFLPAECLPISSLLVSVDSRNVFGDDALLIIDNEWITGSQLPWDFEFKSNSPKMRSANRVVELEIDARVEPIKFSGRLRLNGAEFRMTPTKLKVGQKDEPRWISNFGLVLLQLTVNTNERLVTLSPLVRS